MNFARLNHILIPSTKSERDRVRSKLGVRLLGPLGWFTHATTGEGRALVLFTFAISLTGMRGSQVGLLWTALLGGILVSFIMRRRFALRQLELSVSGPKYVLEGEPIHLRLQLKNQAESAYQALRVYRPFLPWDGRWLGPPPKIPFIAPGQKLDEDISATFIERGEHHLDVFRASVLVPLGITLGPAISSEGFRFCVLPRPANITSFSLKAPPGAQDWASEHARVHRGASFELLGVRDYRPGDPVRDLHAKSWARTGKPHVREYHVPQNQRLLVVFDAVGKRDEPAFEASIRLCAGVLSHLTEEGKRCQLSISNQESSDTALQDALEGSGNLGDESALLTPLFERLACITPHQAPLAELVEKIHKEISLNTEGVIVISASEQRGAELMRAVATLGLPYRCLTVRHTKDELRADELRAKDIDSQWSLAL